MKKMVSVGGDKQACVPCMFSTAMNYSVGFGGSFGDDFPDVPSQEDLINEGVDKGTKYVDDQLKKSGGDLKKLEAAGAGALAGGASGAAIGTMVFPGIGTAVGAIIGAFVGIIGALGEVDHCTITGPSGHKYDCNDFVNNYAKAGNWLKSNQNQAMSMNPQDLVDQFDIPLDNTLFKEMLKFPAAIPDNEIDSVVKLSKAPGAIDMLRTVQLAPAAAWATAHTKIVNQIPDIGSQFPALTHNDLQQIIQKVTPLIKTSTGIAPMPKNTKPKVPMILSFTAKKAVENQPVYVKSSTNPNVVVPLPVAPKHHLWHTFLQFLKIEKRP